MLKSNIFLDTNIVLDIIDSSRVNHPLAKELWKLLVLNECKIMISEDMLSTIYYINKRKKERESIVFSTYPKEMEYCTIWKRCY